MFFHLLWQIIADSNLDTERSSSAVEEILNNFSNRQLDFTSTIENWTTTVVEKKEIEMILEKIIHENQEVSVFCFNYFYLFVFFEILMLKD